MSLQNFSLASIFLVCLTSCKVQYRSTAIDNKSVAVPYNDDSNWAVFEGKTSDGKYVGRGTDSLQADVFFVYPTLLIDHKDTSWNASIEDTAIRDGVKKWIIPYQAAAWASAARIFVPYYRQNHYRAFFEPHLGQGGQQAKEFAYNDVKAAFQYYMRYENKGRPLILAGHSQGAMHLKKIAQEFFDGTELQKQLVAAYLIGTRVLEDDFKHLKPLTSAEQTGGYVSWNSYKKGNLPKYADWYKGAVTTNPITWDNSTTSDLSGHKGLLYYDEQLISSSLSVEVVDGLLWVSLPKVPKRFWVSFIKDYHRFDISFFWQDINENASLRVKEFLTQK